MAVDMEILDLGGEIQTGCDDEVGFRDLLDRYCGNERI
jgi:hypothetical protein